VKRCRAEAGITYLGRGVCVRHWDQLTTDDASPTLREVLGIPAAPVAAMEEAMEPTTSKASKTEPEPTSGRATKIVKAPKPSKKEKPAKETKAKKEKAPREPIESPVVFAFRLSEADRTRIHSAAGPAGATKFVRSAALAAATGDAKAFEALVTQAKSNLK